MRTDDNLIDYSDIPTITDSPQLAKTLLQRKSKNTATQFKYTIARKMLQT